MRAPKAIIRLLGRLHAPVYRVTRGRLGGRVQGAGVLLLTTRGRRSGRARTVPLLFVPDAGAYVVVASHGGHDASPAWCLNLRSQPAAWVLVGRRRVAVTARVLVGGDRVRLWNALVAAYPGYTRYRDRTSREFPIFRLAPRDAE